MKNTFCAILAILSLSIASCYSGPSARVKDKDEPDMVGLRKAGAEVYKDLVYETTAKLLDDYRRRHGKISGQPLICFIGVESESVEELGDWRSSIHTWVTEKVYNASEFQMMDKDAVSHVIKASGYSKKDLYRGVGQEAFLNEVRKGATDPEFLMWGKITSGTTRSGRYTQRDYTMELRLINAETMVMSAFATAQSAKEYDAGR